MTTNWIIDQMNQRGDIIDSTEIEDPQDHYNAWTITSFIIKFTENFGLKKHPDCVWLSVKREDVE